MGERVAPFVKNAIAVFEVRRTSTTTSLGCERRFGRRIPRFAQRGSSMLSCEKRVGIIGYKGMQGSPSSACAGKAARLIMAYCLSSEIARRIICKFAAVTFRQANFVADQV
jgi:hypothetical protein